jgi:hypothetical protein
MMWWKSAFAQDKRLAGILKDNFEEATFLFDIYKTSTITEINQFKWNLENC